MFLYYREIIFSLRLAEVATERAKASLETATRSPRLRMKGVTR
jgi:hypothetical protein